MKTITFNFKAKKTQLFLEEGLAFSEFFLQKMKIFAQEKIALVADQNLAPLYTEKLFSFLKNQGFDIQLFTFDLKEKNKTRETKAAIEDALFTAGFRKNSILISLGGGVTSDIVSFVAATYCRGVKLVLIPTTLLSMVDASIGGKGAVDTSYGKNVLGAVYHPEMILIDPLFLKTLPQKELLNGFAEILKAALLFDKAFFQKLKAKPLLNADLIEKAILLKKNIVEADENEEGLRHSLNFGHTIGHALEKLENFQMAHGQAIALGQIIESYLSHKMGFLNKADFFEIFQAFKTFGFDLLFSQQIGYQDLQKALLLDKKAQSTPKFILLKEIGQVLEDSLALKIDPLKLKESLIWANRRFASKK